jgi:hypothetical protein
MNEILSMKAWATVAAGPESANVTMKLLYFSQQQIDNVC